jgi:hypothetical protein
MAMQTMDQIWKRINSLQHKYVFYTRKEIRALPEILSDGEKINALTSGFLNGQTWLAVCTDRRIIFLNRGWLYGLKQKQMNLDRVQSIDSSHTIFFGTIRLWDGAAAIQINMVIKSSIAPFVRAVQESMDLYKRQMAYDIANRVSSAHATAKVATAEQMTQELERLSKLRDDGHLSEKEFLAAKAKLLS